MKGGNLQKLHGGPAHGMEPERSSTGEDREAESEDGEGSADELWERASALLRVRLNDGNFSAWFGNSTPIALNDNTFVLGVANPFTKEWIETRYLDLLRAALSEVAQREIDVALIPREAFDLESVVEPASLPPAAPEDLIARTEGTDDADLHPKYSFDSFVIGSTNRFAHAAALGVAEGPAQAYNPLFIYGGAGLGKTHLLHAIGRYVRECHSNLKVRYVSTEQFMNEFVLAIQRRTIPNFHSRYRNVDVLLVDDIQFLEGKERTQEEFFHTFNALHPRSQIVLTSDRPPKKIPTLEERLRTRFEWGLITDIQPPDLETRIAILQRKAEVEGLRLAPDVMSFIASRVQTNIRELEGALIRVVAYASLTRTEATVELAQSVLQSLLPDTAEARVTPDLVISVAADYFDVTPDEIRSASRSRPLVNARQMAMYLCRELTDLSLPKIGERFGGRDHSTVVHANNKVRQLMQEQELSYEQVRELTTRIKQRASR